MNSCTGSVVLPVCQGCPPKLCVQELCRPGQKQQMVQVKGACEWKNIRSCIQFRMFFVHDLGVAPYQEIPWYCVIQQMGQLVFYVFFQFTSLSFGTTSSKWLRQKWTNLSALGLMMKAAKLGGLWTRKIFWTFDCVAEVSKNCFGFWHSKAQDTLHENSHCLSFKNSYICWNMTRPSFIYVVFPLHLSIQT